MADQTDKREKDPGEELSADERERRQRSGNVVEAGAVKGGQPSKLEDEIVRKYDPDRLKHMVAKGAGRGERLDLSTRGDMERLIPGHDFSSVRVFRGPLAEEVTKRHKADAVTIGNTGMILVRESPRSAPGTSAGRALLAHELTHVAQAQRGMLFAREGGQDGAHEKEAEHVESQAMNGKGGDDPNSAMKEQARRELIRERVMELMEHERHGADIRRGDTWTW